VIQGIEWDFGTLVTAAGGSDLWPATWAADDHLYLTWGDGGGFGGDNSQGRVTVGVARIEGSPTDWTGFNVFGGVSPESPATFPGKANSLMAVDGSLYMFVTEQDRWLRGKIARSDDGGHTWRFNGGTFDESDWDFTEEGGAFAAAAFLQFGRDGNGSRDGYIYLYSEKVRTQENKDLLLGRVPRDKIQDRPSYEFFTGLDEGDNPRWSANLAAAQPVLTDSAGINWGFAVVYHPVLCRYFLTCRPVDAAGGKFGAWSIFEAPEPWGPWSTAVRYEDWDRDTPLAGANEQILFNFPAKWIDADGQTLWLVASVNDSFNLLRGRLLFAEDAVLPAPVRDSLAPGSEGPD
jgi:hypothetical protein